MKEISPELQRLLRKVCDAVDLEDKAVRQRQIRIWRKLKWMFSGQSRIYYSEVAHDWRTWDVQNSVDSYEDQAYYDKQFNVFRAMLESIFAALSVTVPPIVCFPDDADNALDLETAKAGDKIAELVYRHVNAPLLWLNGLYIWGTEGMVAAYNYSHSDEKYGTYDEEVYDKQNENRYICPSCGQHLEEDDFSQGNKQCPECQQPIPPDIQPELTEVSILKEIKKQPKSRQCIETYGGLYVKIPNYAKKQKDCPYLRFSYESNLAEALARYPKLWNNKDKGKIIGGSSGADSQYEKWGRLSTQYNGEYPINNVTCNYYWLRPCYYNILETKSEADKLNEAFPDGAKVAYVNDVYCEAENEDLDKCWTLTYNPLSDYLQHDPLGMLLVSTQEVLNDVVSLTIQTIEQGVGQTFVDSAALDFDAYRNTEVAPGSIFPIKLGSGKSASDAFHEIKTAALSPEVGPFTDRIQSMGQFVSGAMPQIFGGVDPEASKTASGYAMQRAQSLQRLQNNWKVLQYWWKDIFSKVIPAYIEDVVEDERYVQKDKTGNFVNTLIKKSELEGKIGSVELEANENLPLTWTQQKDVIMQFLQSGNPEMMAALIDPINIEHLSQAIGLQQFSLPGADDRQKQNEEIRLLVNSQPLNEIIPSVEIDPLLDNGPVHIMVCKHWLLSSTGRLAKTENQAGYMNVMLHLKQHMQYEAMQAQMSQQNQAEQEQASKPQNQNLASQGKQEGNNGQFGTNPGVVNS